MWVRRWWPGGFQLLGEAWVLHGGEGGIGGAEGAERVGGVLVWKASEDQDQGSLLLVGHTLNVSQEQRWRKCGTVKEPGE